MDPATELGRHRSDRVRRVGRVGPVASATREPVGSPDTPPPQHRGGVMAPCCTPQAMLNQDVIAHPLVSPADESTQFPANMGASTDFPQSPAAPELTHKTWSTWKVRKPLRRQPKHRADMVTAEPAEHETRGTRPVEIVGPLRDALKEGMRQPSVPSVPPRRGDRVSRTQCAAGSTAPPRRAGTPDLRSIPGAAAICQRRQRRSRRHNIRSAYVGPVGGSVRVLATGRHGLITVQHPRIW